MALQSCFGWPPSRTEVSDCSVCVDWEKTEAQKKKEQMLLEELVSIVNKRDELVRQTDYEEKGFVICLCLLLACFVIILVMSNDGREPFAKMDLLSHLGYLCPHNPRG